LSGRWTAAAVSEEKTIADDDMAAVWWRI